MKRLFTFSFALVLAAVTAFPVKAQEAQLKLPPYKKVKLSNGMTVLLMEQREVPIISMSFIIQAGSVADPVGKEGLASITAGLLRKGTKTRTADQIASELDFIGGIVDAGTGFDYTSGFAEFLKKDVNKGLDIVADVVLNPTFPQAEVTKMQKQRLDGVRAAKDLAEEVIGTYYNAYLYGTHPYARPTGGDEKSLASIMRADVLKFYQTNYTPAGTILAVAGDFDSAEMERLLTQKFGAWPARPAPAVTLPEVTPVSGKRLLLVDKPDATQTFFLIGNVGIARTNEDRAYINVVNTLFGGRFTSMLNTELRIKSGLSYGARSTFSQRKVRGPFSIYSYTRNESTGQAIDLALETLRRLHEKGISEEELQSAKSYIKGVFPTNIETTDQLAAQIAELEFYGLNQDEINGLYAKVDRMTVADAQRVIKQYFPLENLVFVLIGKAAEIQPAVKKYAAKLDTRPISQPGF